MTDMHQKKTHVFLESVLLNQNKMAEEISKLSGLVRSCFRGSPYSALKQTDRAESSMKRSPIAVVNFNDDESEGIDYNGIDGMEPHLIQSSLNISSSQQASSIGTLLFGRLDLYRV